jgi:hypothetical protein
MFRNDEDYQTNEVSVQFFKEAEIVFSVITRTKSIYFNVYIKKWFEILDIFN